MSSSYSSLDWILSHWAHFTAYRSIYLCLSVCILCVCFILHSCCNTVSTDGWTWWDWSLILWTYSPSVLWHCWLGHLTRKNPSRYDHNVWWDVKPYSLSLSYLDSQLRPHDTTDINYPPTTNPHTIEPGYFIALIHMDYRNIIND